MTTDDPTILACLNCPLPECDDHLDTCPLRQFRQTRRSDRTMFGSKVQRRTLVALGKLPEGAGVDKEVLCKQVRAHPVRFDTTLACLERDGRIRLDGTSVYLLKGLKQWTKSKQKTTS